MPTEIFCVGIFYLNLFFLKYLANEIVNSFVARNRKCKSNR